MADLELLRRELDYYRRQIDEVAAENRRLDLALSALQHEVRQKRQGFALLSELAQTLGAHRETSSIFEITIKAINSTLGMDRTVVLVPTETRHVYRPDQWLGFRSETAERFSALTFEFPPEFADGSGVLLVSKSSESTPLIERLRDAFELPYFICVPVIAHGDPIGLLLSGRLTEARPVFPPVDRGDVDTFQAIAGLISASVHTMRMAVLEETDRLKTAFYANISHEFRTPITLTLGPLEQVLAGRYGPIPEPVCEQLTVMLRNQERLLALINQILDLAKLEAGGMELRASPMPDMNRFVEERLEQFRPAAEKRGIELRSRLDPRVRDAELFIDREKFDNLLVNLLANALKFTPKGRIEVWTEIKNGAFCLGVDDTGIGIKQDELPYIFDRFHQGKGGESREYAGTGLGLALVKEFASLHGGDVIASSQAGKGSSFRVVIPLGKAHLNPAWISDVPEEDRLAPRISAPLVAQEGAADQEGVDRLNEEAKARFDPSKRTILYAEDNADLRRHVRDLLAADYNVFLAPDGADALERASRLKPDLILADHMMPHLSGRELLSMVRSDSELSSIPVILLTARAGREARIESLDAGADDYITKPFDEAELAARIRSLLRIKDYQDTIRAQAVELSEWNRTLEVRVREQVEELERLGRLRRFLSPQVAEAIVSSGQEGLLDSHRREIAVVFCDLRGFTAFSETTEPETVMDVLGEYHAAMGDIIFRFEGTLEHFEGDGIIVLFNDPLPCPDPAPRAVRMAVAMRDRAVQLAEAWSKRGHRLGFGVGISLGYATLGKIGFEGRFDYGAIGSVVNLASRLGDEAAAGQILISPRVYAEVEDIVEAEPVGELVLKGFHDPVPACNVVRLR